MILASRSPQRRAILTQLGIEFDARPADVAEVEQGEAADVALANARAKARAVDAAGALVLGVDTVVALDGRLHGKPRDAAEATAMIRTLAGRTHEVVSGLCLRGEGRERTAAATTEVTFRAASAALIDWYVATGEWRERAGGYAIQGRGAVLVAGLRGDYLNVVGLPVAALLDIAPELLPTT